VIFKFCLQAVLQFALYLPAIYPLATDLLLREMSPEMREALRDIFVRIGRAKRITDPT
jgi:brefeldin A-inhibited guanine nucleotide-exchange protein